MTRMTETQTLHNLDIIALGITSLSDFICHDD